MDAVSNLQRREKNPGEDLQNNPGAQDNHLMAQNETGGEKTTPDYVVQIGELPKFSMLPQHGAVDALPRPLQA